MLRPRLIGILLATVPALAQGLSAQEAVIVRGRVSDASNLGAVVEAFVAQEGSVRGVVSDSAGMFALPLDPRLARAIRVSRLGYAPLRTEVPPGPVEGRLLNVMLVPDPVQLEGLTVLGRRLAERRRGPYGVVDVLEGPRLAEVSAASGYDLVRRVMPFAEPCDRQTTEALCMMGRRGTDGPRQVEVCIDGSRVPPEFLETFLSDLDPRGLYMVEVYRLVGEVRLYTPAYIQRFLGDDADLPPLSFGCTGPGGG